MIKKFNITHNENNYIIIIDEENNLAIKPIFEALTLENLEEHKQALLLLKKELKELIK